MRLTAFSVDAGPPGLDRVVDVALAAALVVVAQVLAWGGSFRGPIWPNALFCLAMTVPLAWRRRVPVLVLALVVTVIGAQALIFGATETAAVLLPLLVAVYSAAAYGGPAYVVACIALLGVVVHDLCDPLVDSLSQAWFSPVVTFSVFAVGRVVHARRRQAEEAADLVRVAEQDRERAIAAAVAAEQPRLGREVHDVVAHSIAVMALHAGATEQLLDRSPDRAREGLRLIQRTGHDAVREMRRLLSAEQSPTRDPLPSIRTTPELVEGVREAGLDAELVVLGPPRDLTPVCDLTLYRVVQEGLTNALKHAPTARTVVTVRYQEDAVVVEVVSQGPPGHGRGGGSRRGLRGIAERVEAAGGHLDAGPDGSTGWRLVAVVPDP
ncbi:MAG: sensor histidine kinase [Intrasporangium sp.]|uniref:sensor histidine kinase n=1 Tax=Intrasporangium sp. TaxID=1925024 RepID=UPI003F7D8F00